MDTERYTELRMPWDSVLRTAWEHEVAGRSYAAAEAYARGARMLGEVDEKRAQCDFKRAFELLESSGPAQFQSEHPVKLHPYGRVEDVLAEGPLKIYAPRGQTRPVCVGNYILLVDAMEPNIDISGGTGRLRFPSEQLFLTLPDDEMPKALTLLRPAQAYVFAHDASQAITSVSQRVADALESGGQAVGGLILSGAENLVSRRRVKWVQQQSANPAPRSNIPGPIVAAANFTVNVVHMAARALQTVQGWLKTAGSRIVDTVSTLAGGEEAHPAVRAAGQLASSLVVGILSVFGGLWRGIGGIFAGIGNAVVMTARARFGPHAAHIAVKVVDEVGTAAKVVGAAANLNMVVPGAMIQGAFPTDSSSASASSSKQSSQSSSLPPPHLPDAPSSSIAQPPQHHGQGIHKAKLHGERKKSKQHQQDSNQMRQRPPSLASDDNKSMQ